jgi:hypothetical protein
MSHSEADSSPLSSPPPSSPEQALSINSNPPAPPSAPSFAQPEESSVETPSLGPSVQVQQAQASESVAMAAPTSNMSVKRAPRQSPKRAREEDSDSEEAFGTPPPKRAAIKTKRTANGKTVAKKAASPRKAALKKPIPKKTPAKKAAPALISSRPSRSRKAPERLEDVQEKPTPKALPNKKGPSKVFDPIFITTNSTSRLAKADIYVSAIMLFSVSCLTRSSAHASRRPGMD